MPKISINELFCKGCGICILCNRKCVGGTINVESYVAEYIL